MDRRFLTVLGVSLVFALVVSSIFYQITARAGSGPRKAEASEQKDIVIAARPLGVGVTVKPGDVKLAKIAVESYPKGAFGKVEEVIDRPVVSNILMDEPLQEGRLAVRGSGLGLAPIIPVGMRAVSVRVNDVAGVAGFVRHARRRPGNGPPSVNRRVRNQHLPAEHPRTLRGPDNPTGCPRPSHPGAYCNPVGYT